MNEEVLESQEDGRAKRFLSVAVLFWFCSFGDFVFGFVYLLACFVLII